MFISRSRRIGEAVMRRQRVAADCVGLTELAAYCCLAGGGLNAAAAMLLA